MITLPPQTLNKALTRQREIQETIDIRYTAYVLKLKESQLWAKYLPEFQQPNENP